MIYLTEKYKVHATKSGIERQTVLNAHIEVLEGENLKVYLFNNLQQNEPIFSLQLKVYPSCTKLI